MQYLRKPLDTMAFKLFVAARDTLWKTSGRDENLIICPFTVTSLSALLYYACEGSAANRQMESILRFGDLFEGRSEARAILMAFREAYIQLTKHEKEMAEDELGDAAIVARNFHLIFANKIFVQKDVDVHDEFLEKISRNLKIDVEKMEINQDPQRSLMDIEEWLLDKIQHRFPAEVPKNLIDDEYHGPRAVIASAALYRAGWDAPFSREQTYWGTFKADDGRTSQVEYMTMKSTFPYTIDERVGVKMIEIPYFHNSASLVVTIPIKKSTSLQQMLAKFPPEYFTELHMRRRMKLVNLHLPKFFITSTFDMKTLLSSAGIRDVFLDESPLSQLTPEKNFRLSEGFLKFSMQVDEDGTFATDDCFTGHDNPPPDRKGSGHSAKGSGTGSGFSLPGFFQRSSKTKEKEAGPPMEDFIADTSFLVAARHNKSSLFIFSGCVMCPTG